VLFVVFAKVSLKSSPYRCWNPLATHLALYIGLGLLFEGGFSFKTQRPLITFISGVLGFKTQVFKSFRLFISLFRAFCHSRLSEPFNTSGYMGSIAL